jgi:transposase InsO family protein
MSDLIRLVFGLIVDLFRSRAALEAEILVLRQQIIVLRRRKATRLPFTAADRLVLGWVCRLFPKACDALAVRPETVLRWHRAGFRSYWRWKSRRRSGRPAISAEIRQLIREMSIANRDACYGSVFIRRLRSLGIRDHPISPRSPWQNGYAERLIGSIRRECLDHVVVFGERHLRHVLSCYQLLQCGSHASVPGQRHSGPTCRSINRTHPSAACSRRLASPIRSDLIYDRDRFTKIL